ncbi:TetR/AcrR family transcriptional regulator [Parahaliea mediterranea]|uniref:TetR/AcrR family transcriptional regulator n=1 Tax=Parahaliea mediterranea TaxID=651086 RepID=A0A939IK60_9GAMM|nr:TetR/AcrR family transcriptional regulator [Parahaliea mediterranea]MBN7795120.1 TetR/AcrR family transcriptional regulator [Parahaliea mediterranea]
MSNDKPTSSPFNRSAQHDAKRAAILSQAAKLFNSKGSRATTLQDIAATLGLTKTSLYYYVKTKEELIYQCYMAALQHHLRQMDEIEAQTDDPLLRARAFFLRHFENWLAAQEGRGPYIAALLEIASLKEPHRKEVEAVYITMFKRLRQYLRDGIAEGKFRKLDTTSATRAIIGSVDWTFSWLHSIPRDKVMDAANSAADILSHGLYAGRGQYTPTRGGIPRAPASFVQGFDREEQNRLKQQAFYKAGTWFFNKQGFNGTSLDEIAEHLNVSKGAFYYHIKNKEDLLYNCYTYSQDATARIHAEAKKIDGSGLEKVAQVCRGIFRVQNSDEGPLIRYNTITALPIDRRREILKRTEASNARFGDFIREGIDDGSVRQIDTVIAQNLIAGAINASMDIGLWRRVDDLESAANDYFDIFYNGVLPRE